MHVINWPKNSQRWKSVSPAVNSVNWSQNEYHIPQSTICMRYPLDLPICIFQKHCPNQPQSTNATLEAIKVRLHWPWHSCNFKTKISLWKLLSTHRFLLILQPEYVWFFKSCAVQHLKLFPANVLTSPKLSLIEHYVTSPFSLIHYVTLRYLEGVRLQKSRNPVPISYQFSQVISSLNSCLQS